jgi:hypothetical protein
MMQTWNVVLAHDATYTSVLTEWKWLFVLPLISKEFADTLRPLRTRLMKIMTEKDPGPLLWPSKVKALFSIFNRHPLLMRSAALPHGLSFEAINARFRQKPQITRKTEQQLRDEYHAFRIEHGAQMAKDEADYHLAHRNARIALFHQADETRAQLERLRIQYTTSSQQPQDWTRFEAAQTECLQRMQNPEQCMRDLRHARDAKFQMHDERLHEAKSHLKKALRDLQAAAQAKEIAVAHKRAFLELYD